MMKIKKEEKNETILENLKKRNEKDKWRKNKIKQGKNRKRNQRFGKIK